MYTTQNSLGNALHQSQHPFHHLCSHFHIMYSLHCADPPKSYTHTAAPVATLHLVGAPSVCPPPIFFLTTVDFHGCTAIQFNIWTHSALPTTTQPPAHLIAILSLVPGGPMCPPAITHFSSPLLL